MLALRRFVIYWSIFSPAFFFTVCRSRSLENISPRHGLGNTDAVGPLTVESPYKSGTNITELNKRGEYLYSWTGHDPGPDVTSILEAAFREMIELVTYVENHPDRYVLARYFPVTAQDEVTAIFRTVRLMAQPGGHPNPIQSSEPNDLRRIRLSLENGYSKIATLAEATGTRSSSAEAAIMIYQFGWGALWQRLRATIKCSDIGPKTNYKMHFLGSLMLHETLHFNNVARLAWNPNLDAEQCPDDQKGQYACLHKAYGPFEAIQLRNIDSPHALLNIENYIWYALEIYWRWQCPTRTEGMRLFEAPKDNDIPGMCKSFKGGLSHYLSNVWCWRS